MKLWIVVVKNEEDEEVASAVFTFKKEADARRSFEEFEKEFDDIGLTSYCHVGIFETEVE